jgi:hypothetical protein
MHTASDPQPAAIDERDPDRERAFHDDELEAWIAAGST